MKRVVICVWMLVAVSAGFAPQTGWCWGIHPLLSKAAVELLPEWQHTLIKDSEKGFIQRYCNYPDIVREPDAAFHVLKFPAEVKVSHHIPNTLEHQKLLFDAYLPRIVDLLRAGKIDEAMRFFGSLGHFLEDSATPCHMAYGEAMVPPDGPPLLQGDFFKRFMLLPDIVDQEMLHSRIDGCKMTQEQLCKAVEGHRPRLLGHSVEELTFNLLEEHFQMNARSSRLLIPMVAALAAEDEAKFIEHGIQAAANGSRLVADVLYTMLSIAQSRFDTQPETEVSLADRTPARSNPFAWSDKNHLGRLIRNASGAVYSTSDPPQLGRHPLKLKMPDGQVREFAKGYGVGWRSEYTFLLPRGIFKTFTVTAGNDADIGREGTNTFEVLLDDKPVAATPRLKGEAVAQCLEVSLGEASTLTLRCKSEGPASRVHGVWANPILKR